MPSSRSVREMRTEIYPGLRSERALTLASSMHQSGRGGERSSAVAYEPSAGARRVGAFELRVEVLVWAQIAHDPCRDACD